jgi:DNA-binding XRE family transcriptional regulator
VRNFSVLSDVHFDPNRHYKPEELAEIVRAVRLKTGKTHAQIAAELGVAKSTVVQAEAEPNRSLSQIRRRIIETYSDWDVVGPVYVIKARGNP